ncbi:ABC transporter permease [Bifidobacterium sp. SO1]|uniref:ABC transporter permease n=1 Tax=Bifidobacterium sp. SO1 TaxID=2809029 RepID=UPI001BDD628B|nr:ABC transporter permease [Bifidobacterium sp. SO1]MBT1160403.1 ABC transporter permease [Bifidobacterium sp. SO1]
MKSTVNSFLIFWRLIPGCDSKISFLVMLIISPSLSSLFYALFAYSGGVNVEIFSSILAATINVCCVKTITNTAYIFAYDRFSGVQPYILMKGNSPFAKGLGRFLSLFCASSISGTSSIAFAFLLSQKESFNARQLVYTIIILIFSICTSIIVGILFSGLSLLFHDALWVSNFLEYALPILSGAVAPVSIFPPALRVVSEVFPSTWLTDSMRKVANGVYGDINFLAILILSLVWFLLTYILWVLCSLISRRFDNIRGFGF